MFLNLICAVYNYGFYKSLISNNTIIFSDLSIYLIMGGVVSFLLVNLIITETISFFMIVEHEFTHLITALITFNPVIAMNINIKKGGYVKIEGGNSLIAIMPYLIPLYLIIFVLLKMIVISTLHNLIIIIIGFLEMFYLFRLFKEIHFSQTDFRVLGTFKSLLTIVNFNLLIQGILFILVFSEAGHYLSIAVDSYYFLKELTSTIFSQISLVVFN